MREQVAHAVRNAGTPAPILKYMGYRAGQAKALIDLTQQPNPTVADNVATVKRRFNDAPSNLPNSIGSLVQFWHQRFSVAFGVRNQ